MPMHVAATLLCPLASPFSRLNFSRLAVREKKEARLCARGKRSRKKSKSACNEFPENGESGTGRRESVMKYLQSSFSGRAARAPLFN